MAKRKIVQPRNERYQENLERQAENIFRSWGLVEKADGSWAKPEKKRRRGSVRKVNK